MWLSVFYYVAVVIIMAYMLITIMKFGEIPPSISETYYMWKGVGKEWLFTFVMWIVGISILIYWVSVAKDYRCQFLSFLSVAGMCFVGGACMFKQTLTKEVHYASAGVWAGCATIFFLANQMFLPMIAGLVSGLVGWSLDRFRDLTFWAEFACVGMMIIGIFLL